MTWWMRSVAARPFFEPDSIRGLPKYKADAHRLYMAGQSLTLMKGTTVERHPC